MIEPQELYGLALDQFTPARNALAKELRGQGRGEDAAAVAKLRKPSVAAWAVNQLVRTQQRDVDALFVAGDTLRRAQADLLAGRGDPSALRAAVEQEREAVAGLVSKARGLLNSDGHELSQSRLEQVAETLHAAALEDDARAAMRDGCLERELRHVGLGSLDAPTRGAKAKARRPSGRATGSAGSDRRERAAAAKAAREAEATATRRLERATREERSAEQRRDRAAAELASAEEALARARDALADAQTQAEQARRALEQL